MKKKWRVTKGRRVNEKARGGRGEPWKGEEGGGIEGDSNKWVLN